MELSFTQCKQIAAYQDLRDMVELLKDQPDWLAYPETHHNSETGDTRQVWRKADLSIADIQAIQQGGCASGAYMPAVTYWQASQTMAEHGDDVLQYIEDNIGELPEIPRGLSWSGIAVFFLSYAVELWAAQFELSNVDWE